MREMAKLLNWQILVWLCPTAEPQTDQNNNEWDDDDDDDDHDNDEENDDEDDEDEDDLYDLFGRSWPLWQ